MKKIMTALAAIAVAFSLMGCMPTENGVNWTSYTKDKQNKIAYYAQIKEGIKLSGSWYIPDTTFFAADDTEGVIKGFDNKYTVEYENKGSSLYRAYKETTFNHAGAVIKVTFDNASVGASKMGVIFDLKANATDKNAKDFYIIGLNPSAKNSAVANFYVSKYTNVTDIQAENFGTKLATNPAKEVEIVGLNTKNNITVPAADAEGKVSFYVYFKLMEDGSFDYAVLDMTDDDLANFKGTKKFQKANIDDYTVLVKGNTKEKAGAEYPEAEVKKSSGLF